MEGNRKAYCLTRDAKKNPGEKAQSKMPKTVQLHPIDVTGLSSNRFVVQKNVFGQTLAVFIFGITTTKKKRER